MSLSTKSFSNITDRIQIFILYPCKIYIKTYGTFHTFSDFKELKKVSEINVDIDCNTLSGVLFEP